MVMEREEVLTFLLLAVLLLKTVTCFNLEPSASRIYGYPYATTQGRDSYFGFSVALQHNQRTEKNWLMVGAPRANSSIYNDNQITEPGAMFKCDLLGETCEEYVVDASGNTLTNQNQKPQYDYQDLKNYGWLGATLDTQPRISDNRQVTGVCAPRWKNQIYTGARYMNGACYWLDESESEPSVRKELPLVNYKDQTMAVSGGNIFYHYGFGEAGMSIHFPEDQTKFIVGAPGVFNWHGTVILFEDVNWNVPGEAVQRRRRQIFRRKQLFSQDFIPNPYYISTLQDGDLFGYAVTSGRFFSNDEINFVGSAPRGGDSHGKVIVFNFPPDEKMNLIVKKEIRGVQMGEYFGAAMTAADINGDGLSDLIVGSPMYSLSDKPDVGKIQTFLSTRGLGLHISPEPHFGNLISVGRFGTSIISPGDLNADGYEDIIVGAPWEDMGAVYIFLGSSGGLRRKYSQRLSPEDFPVKMQGFGMSLSRGTDIDKNGYPDLAIGSFLSGHVAVIRARPVAVLSGYLKADPPNIAWEGSASLTLQSCLHLKGHSLSGYFIVQVTLTLDHGSPAPRAVFSNNAYTQISNLNMLVNNVKDNCKSHQVTVKNDKIDPDQPIVMKMEYELIRSKNLETIQQPMTNPGEIHSNITRVGILKGCAEKTCKVDLMFDADLNLGKGNKLVVGERTKPVLRVKVSNIGEPVYLPSMTVKVDPPLSLLLPVSHDCKFLDVDLRSSLECSLSNPIKKGYPDTVEVSVDPSQLEDSSSNVGIQVDVSGEGYELKPDDNYLSMGLLLEANANLEIYGHSKEEQVFYEHLGEDRLNATINPRIAHTYLVIKKGPTPIGQVDLIIDIPVNLTNGETLVKLYPPRTEFLGQPFQCTLSNGKFDVDVNKVVNQDDSISSIDDEKSINQDLVHSRKPVIVTAEMKGDGPQYFNCSSGLMKCARLYCSVYSWPSNTESAKISLDLEVDLKILAKHMSINGGAVLRSSATTSIQSLNPQLAFVGKKEANEDIVTYIQPDTLQSLGIPWWIILLAVLGGLLLLGLLAYGLYKSGFFKREKMEEMKTQRANLISPSSYGSTNPGIEDE